MIPEALLCHPTGGSSPPPPPLVPALPPIPTQHEITAAGIAAAEKEESAAIENSVNFPGGDADGELNIEPAGNVVVHEDKDFKCVRQQINYYKRKGTKENPGPTDAEYLIDIDSELLEMANMECCPSTYKRKCQCLHVLRDANKRWPVAKFLLGHFKKDKNEQDNLVVSWYQYASSFSANQRAKNWFLLPFDNTPCDEDDPAIGNVNLVGTRICTSGLLSILNYTKHYMKKYVAMGTNLES